MIPQIFTRKVLTHNSVTILTPFVIQVPVTSVIAIYLLWKSPNYTSVCISKTQLFATKQLTPSCCSVDSKLHFIVNWNPMYWKWYYSDAEVYPFCKTRRIHFETKLLFRKISYMLYGIWWEPLYGREMWKLCKRFSMVSHLPLHGTPLQL